MSENKSIQGAASSSQNIDSEPLSKHLERTRIDLDHEDEINPRMTASYSEISFNSDQSDDETECKPPDKASSGPSRPLSLSCQSANSSESGKPLDLDGQVVYEGDMTHFVADDLEYKIKISSPITKKSIDFGQVRSRSGTPIGSLYRQLLAPQMGSVDVNILNDLEHEARRIAQSVDSLIENLSGVLHSISSITADNVEVYKDSVAKTCDAMDSNIKSMYTILAKGEEVSQAMRPVQAHAARITEIRRLLNLFENNL